MKFICKYCKKEFDSYKKNRVYCSKSCYTFDIHGIQPERLRGKSGLKHKNQKNSFCLVCNKEFSHWAGREAKYCSRKCWNNRRPRILENCLYCGKEFMSYEIENKKYCSHVCYSFHKRELCVGENSHLWRGGLTKKNKLMRNKVIYEEWRNAVFLRDNYICQNCGKQNGNGTTVHLQAHHIKLFSIYVECRFDVNNGITLCKPCHLLEHHHKF